MKRPILHNMKSCALKARSRNSFSCFRYRGGKMQKNRPSVGPPLPEPKSIDSISQSPRSHARHLRPVSAIPCGPLREGSASKFDLWHMLCSIGIPKKKRRCDVPIFALNRGRPDERYEAKTQQSTIYSFEYTSWARVAALLEGSECCGSLTSTSLQRHFLNILLVFFTWLIVTIMTYPAVHLRRS